jgi:hypothetical protein
MKKAKIYLSFIPFLINMLFIFFAVLAKILWAVFWISALIAMLPFALLEQIFKNKNHD